MNFPLQPGEHVTWRSKSGRYSVRVQRTDAGQTWTAEARRGEVTLDKDVFGNEEDARAFARMNAEFYRDLEVVEMKGVPA